MERIIGIDPGSRVTGFGVIDCSNSRMSYIASGTIDMPDGNLPSRLNTIYQGIQQIVEKYQPQTAVVEDLFIAVNPRSALMLGHARGSAICALAASGIEIYEYSTREIKKSITGNGAAAKVQVQYMVRMLLCLPSEPKTDEADALASAIAHYQHMPQSQKMHKVLYADANSQPLPENSPVT